MARINTRSRDPPAGSAITIPPGRIDGTIAFWEGTPSGEDGGPSDADIYTIPAIGGPVTRLTHDADSDIEPAWSPDGSRIAYWHYGTLRIMGADGSHSREVYAPNGGAWAPAWSPDGTSIAFISYVRNLPGDGAPLMQLRTIELKSERVTKLDVHSVTDWNGPQWVSDGEILINRYN